MLQFWAAAEGLLFRMENDREKRTKQKKNISNCTSPVQHKMRKGKNEKTI